MNIDIYQLLRPRLWDGANTEYRRRLKALLGFYPHSTSYYTTAFVHSSSEARGKNGRPLNNERLEYLGDAVLEAVVSDIIFHHYPRRREGFLTSTRSKIVQRTTLNQLADRMGIMELMQLPMRPKGHNNIGGNAFEALMGAIYLDRGYNHCYNFVQKQVLGKYIDLEKLAKKEENFKSKLLEWSQKNKLKMEFRDISCQQQDDKSSYVFVCHVFVEGVKVGEGKGGSKKESHQQAARNSLQRLHREKALMERIYAAKEQRTQMEASEYAVLPEE